jgi:hypothetical protein
MRMEGRGGGGSGNRNSRCLKHKCDNDVVPAKAGTHNHRTLR